MPAIVRRHYLLVSAWVLLLLPIPAFSDDPAVTSPFERCEGFSEICPETVDILLPDSAGAVADEESIFSLLDGPSEFIGFSLNGFARSIDEFLADEKLYYESSGSFIRIKVDSIWWQRSESGFLGSVRMKLKLPRTNEKYKLVIESDPDKMRDALDSDVDVQNSPVEAADKQEYFAGLQAVAGRKDRWRYRAGIGVKLRSPVDSYVRIGARRTYLFDIWSLHLDESMYWFDRAGQTVNTAIELNRRLQSDLLFRSSSQAHWTEANDYYETSQVFTLYQTLDENRLVSFQAGVYGQSEPAMHATDYRVSMSFRKNLRRKYLFLELIPQVRYQKINNFAAERGVVLRLEWFFQG